jgi:hypothetical protein
MNFVKLHEIKKNNDGKYYLVEVHVNVSHIVFISENADMSRDLREGKLNIGLNTSAKFSNLSLYSNNNNTRKIVVVGSPDVIESKINKTNKTLLRG